MSMSDCTIIYRMSMSDCTIIYRMSMSECTIIYRMSMSDCTIIALTTCKVTKSETEMLLLVSYSL
jgi:hypothetical protein